MPKLGTHGFDVLLSRCIRHVEPTCYFTDELCAGRATDEQLADLRGRFVQSVEGTGLEVKQYAAVWEDRNGEMLVGRRRRPELGLETLGSHRALFYVGSAAGAGNTELDDIVGVKQLFTGMRILRR